MGTISLLEPLAWLGESWDGLRVSCAGDAKSVFPLIRATLLSKSFTLGEAGGEGLGGDEAEGLVEGGRVGSPSLSVPRVARLDLDACAAEGLLSARNRLYRRWRPPRKAIAS
jgi:hypothetical protein